MNKGTYPSRARQFFRLPPPLFKPQNRLALENFKK
jgi:hypothetical protein